MPALCQKQALSHSFDHLVCGGEQRPKKEFLEWHQTNRFLG